MSQSLQNDQGCSVCYVIKINRITVSEITDYITLVQNADITKTKSELIQKNIDMKRMKLYVMIQILTSTIISL